MGTHEFTLHAWNMHFFFFLQSLLMCWSPVSMSHTDMENFQNIEDEPFPSFLSNASLGSSGRSTLSNLTLGSTLGMPMAASTVAKIRPPVDNRWETSAFNLMNIVTMLTSLVSCLINSVKKGSISSSPIIVNLDLFVWVITCVHWYCKTTDRPFLCNGFHQTNYNQNCDMALCAYQIFRGYDLK